MRFRYLVIALALLASFASDSWGQSKRQPSNNETPSKQDAQATAPDQRGTDKMPLSVKILPGEKTETETTKEKYEAEEKPSLDRALSAYTGWLAIFTAALFAAAAIQVGLFYWQLRLIGVASEDAKKASIAAERAAKATEDAVELSRITAERQLRAYLIVMGTNLESKPRTLVSHFKIENTGQTPAHNVRVKSNTCVLQHPLRSDFDFSLTDLPNPSAVLIGSRKVMKGASAFGADEVTEEEFEEATADDGWLRIYSYGTVLYEDVFGHPQWTNFCFYFQWEGSSQVAATISEYHNTAS